MAKSDVTAGETKEEDRQTRPQNQVALVALCEVVSAAVPASGTPLSRYSQRPQSDTVKRSAPFILSTTHLKASKNSEGEQLRLKETQQLLAAVDRCYINYVSRKIVDKAEADFRIIYPAVILTGDLNACPSSDNSPFGYECRVYPYVQQSPRSYLF